MDRRRRDTVDRIMTLLDASAEALGTEIRAAALALMAEDLAPYPLEAIEKALWRCRREVTGRLTLAAVIERIQEEDGRPSTEEAWALSVPAEDERQTVVWTAEMAEAFAAARSLLELGDKVGARMAFRDVYQRLVSEARLAVRPARWMVSLGWDTELRTEAIQKAVAARRLSAEEARRYLPAPADTGPIVQALLSGKVMPHPALPPDRLERLHAIIASAKHPTERARAERQTQNTERRERIETAREKALQAVEELIERPDADNPSAER